MAKLVQLLPLAALFAYAYSEATMAVCSDADCSEDCEEETVDTDVCEYDEDFDVSGQVTCDSDSVKYEICNGDGCSDDCETWIEFDTGCTDLGDGFGSVSVECSAASTAAMTAVVAAAAALFA